MTVREPEPRTDDAPAVVEPAVPARGRWPRRPDARAALVVTLSLASAALAVIVSRQVFPFLSVNNDEAINRLQADAIAHGHLFLPTRGLPDAFRPWLAGVVDGHYVLKYAPVVPALMAASQLLTGGTGLYLAVVASTTVVMTYLLALEVLGDRTEALVAAALVACSPLVIVHSGLLLSYLPTLVLLETFAWGLLRGLSRRANGLLAASGLALGLALCTRPLDAVVFGVPVLVWAAFRPRASARPTIASYVSFVVPVAATLAALLLFHLAATGSPWRPPFSLLEPQDGLGFGVRRLYPTDAPHRFGLWQGLDGVVRHGALLTLWLAGGPILVALAVVTVVRRRVHGAGWALVGVAALVPVSYVFFWGPWNATVLWRGVRHVGPFYFLVLAPPLAVLGARALVRLYRRRAAAALALAAAMSVVTVVTVVQVIPANLAFTGTNRSLARLVADRQPEQLVFARMPTPFLMHPTAVLSNRWDLSGPVVYAIERRDADLDAVARFPGRVPYRLRFDAEFLEPDEKVSARLEELQLVRGDRVDLSLRLRRPSSAATVGVAVSAFGTRRVYPLGPDDRYAEQLVLDASGARIPSRAPLSEERLADRRGLRVDLLVWPQGSEAAATVASEALPSRAGGGPVQVLAPSGPTWTVGNPAEPLVQLSSR